MKKFLLLCLLLPLAWCNAAHAQRILIGKRAPELRIATWLADSKPASAPLTYIEFYHSSNPSGLASLDRLRELVRHADRRLRVIIVTREAPEAVAERLAPYVSEFTGVGFDPSGRTTRPSRSTMSPSGCSPTPATACCGWATRCS